MEVLTMIYPDKVYIPVVRGCNVWSVVEIDTAKAKKTPPTLYPAISNIITACTALAMSFCRTLTRGTGYTFSAAIAAKCIPPKRSVAFGR